MSRLPGPSPSTRSWTGLRRRHGKAFDVTGDLTVHGVTRSVAVAGEYRVKNYVTVRAAA